MWAWNCFQCNLRQYIYIKYIKYIFWAIFALDMHSSVFSVLLKRKVCLGGHSHATSREGEEFRNACFEIANQEAFICRVSHSDLLYDNT